MSELNFIESHYSSDLDDLNHLNDSNVSNPINPIDLVDSNYNINNYENIGIMNVNSIKYHITESELNDFHHNTSYMRLFPKVSRINDLVNINNLRKST